DPDRVHPRAEAGGHPQVRVRQGYGVVYLPGHATVGGQTSRRAPCARQKIADGVGNAWGVRKQSGLQGRRSWNPHIGGRQALDDGLHRATALMDAHAYLSTESASSHGFMDDKDATPSGLDSSRNGSIINRREPA